MRIPYSARKSIILKIIWNSDISKVKPVNLVIYVVYVMLLFVFLNYVRIFREGKYKVNSILYTLFNVTLHIVKTWFGKLFLFSLTIYRDMFF